MRAWVVVGAMAIVAAVVLAGCGGDGDDRPAELRAAVAALPTPPDGPGWADAPDATDGCPTRDGVQLPPTAQLVAGGTDDPEPYLDAVEAALPADARQVQRTDDRLSWTTLSKEGDPVRVQLFASDRSTTVTATGPLAWCD